MYQALKNFVSLLHRDEHPFHLGAIRYGDDVTFTALQSVCTNTDQDAGANVQVLFFFFFFSFPRYAEFRVQGPSALVENARCQTVSAALMWQSHTLPTECPYNRVSLLNNVSMARHLVAVQEEAIILPCLQMKYTLIINMTDVVLLDRQSIEV